MTWLADRGFGFYPIDRPAPYDQAYFDKYRGYARTPLGAELTRQRVDLVNAYVPQHFTVVDVGIGCGQFLQAMLMHRRCRGFDVNPVAVKMLNDTGLWSDPYNVGADVLTFWDSFEHIQAPGRLLDMGATFVFISMPIFRDQAHAASSKHFRPDEHWWYFTSWGLIREMECAGYRCLEMNYNETKAGREDIGTFVFEQEK